MERVIDLIEQMHAGVLKEGFYSACPLGILTYVSKEDSSWYVDESPGISTNTSDLKKYPSYEAVRVEPLEFLEQREAMLEQERRLLEIRKDKLKKQRIFAKSKLADMARRVGILK
jgi:hypothetical protein